MIYSFDVFDTVITRKTATPTGIFKRMQDCLVHDRSYEDMSGYVRSNFYDLRIKIEKLARVDYCYNGRQDLTLEQIYAGFVKTGHVSEKQACRLEELEIRTESENVLGIWKNIEDIKNLLLQGSRVILISDMYLRKETVRDMLLKVDRTIAGLPLYVSSEYEKNKWNGDLYPIVKAQENVDYSDWIHKGDNIRSDVEIPRNFGIKTQRFFPEELSGVEKYALAHDRRGIGVEYGIAASRYVRMEYGLEGASAIGASAGANILMPYVLWVIQETLRNDIRRLYFIARDGYILKQIADRVIRCKGYDIQTKYIYGSRKAWRLPAFSKTNDSLVDLISWSHTQKMDSLDKLADAFGLDSSELLDFLPNGFERHVVFTPYTLYLTVCQLDKNSSFKQHLIKKYRKEREVVKRYLSENIDISDSRYAFVELAGGGYTQRCLADMLREIAEDKGFPMGEEAARIKTFYFKMDRLNKWEECQQYVFFPEYNVKNIIVEMVCRACHGQTIGYQEKDGKVVPRLDDEGKELLSYGYDSYIDGIMKYTEYACGENQAMLRSLYEEGVSIASLYLTYLTETKESEEFLFFADMPNNVTGREKDWVRFAPCLTEDEIEKIFYSKRFSNRDTVYKGTCFELSLLRCTEEQRELIQYYRKKANAENQGVAQAKTFENCLPLWMLGKRIVLYAAGRYGRQLYDIISASTNHTVVQWIDQDSQNLTSEKIQIDGMEELGKKEYDSILIGVMDGQVAAEIRDALQNRGAMPHKIYWFKKADIYQYMVWNVLFRWM